MYQKKDKIFIADPEHSKPLSATVSFVAKIPTCNGVFTMLAYQLEDSDDEMRYIFTDSEQLFKDYNKAVAALEEIKANNVISMCLKTIKALADAKKNVDKAEKTMISTFDANGIYNINHGFSKAINDYINNPNEEKLALVKEQLKSGTDRVNNIKDEINSLKDSDNDKVVIIEDFSSYVGISNMVDKLVQRPHRMAGIDNDSIWLNTEKHLILALCYYVFEVYEKERHTLTDAYLLLNHFIWHEKEEKSMLEKLFSILEEKNPSSAAVSEFKTFMKKGSLLKSSFATSCAIRFLDFLGKR